MKRTLFITALVILQISLFGQFAEDALRYSQDFLTGTAIFSVDHCSPLYVKSEMHNITIFYKVLFPLNTQAPGLFYLLLRLVLKEIFAVINFCFYKTSFKTGGYYARGLGILGAYFNRPGTHFLNAGGGEGLKPK